MSPDLANAAAASAASAHPSYRIAPPTAPPIRPPIRCQAIGGPACRIVRLPRLGSTSRATPMPSRRGCAAIYPSAALAFAGLQRRMVDEARECHADRAIAAGRRRPLEPRGGAAALHDGVGERGDAFVQDRQRLAEKRAPPRPLIRDRPRFSRPGIGHKNVVCPCFWIS